MNNFSSYFKVERKVNLEDDWLTVKTSLEKLFQLSHLNKNFFSLKCIFSPNKRMRTQTSTNLKLIRYLQSHKKKNILKIEQLKNRDKDATNPKTCDVYEKSEKKPTL